MTIGMRGRRMAEKKEMVSCPETITIEGGKRYVVAMTKLELPALESDAPLDRILARARLLEGRCAEIA